MPHLIIGHTTETTARIWVRGESSLHTCDVAVRSSAGPAIPPIQGIRLDEETDYTGTVDFKELAADREYTVEATFLPGPGPVVSGRFRTVPSPLDHAPVAFSFVLSSCNLSVVSINNFLARLLATAGSAIAMSSLDLPLERWLAPRFTWLRRPARFLLKIFLALVAKGVEKSTGLKQPGPPYIRSPLLKVSAVFDSWVLELAGMSSVPAVGDVVSTPGATGVVAWCSTTADAASNAGWRLVLAQVDGVFKRGDLLSRRAQTASDTEKQPDSKQVGIIAGVWHGKPWHTPPSFFLHAGDQIYFDFPVPNRVPDRSEYRLAYREAWFYDPANRHLLSHWPHYMTLDDHEIADQFARDFKPPAEGVSPNTYFEEAAVAYREYVQARNPRGVTDADGKGAGPFWYSFSKGRTRFFVLDTRTRRFDRGTPPQIIDDDQMNRLLQWMTKFKDDLKFVVTSVPFVAEVKEAREDSEKAERDVTWFDRNRGADPTPASAENKSETAADNPANDKWNPRRFTRQRSQIIEYIAKNRVEQLVFLTGDMHCCYHASMRIGDGSKYSSITVHELAGGPVNQLQLANVDEFQVKKTARTENGVRYEVALDRFHSQVNAVMHLNVLYVERDRITSPAGLPVPDRPLTPEVEWNVIRTLTDSGADAWAAGEVVESAPAARSLRTSRDETSKFGEPVMAGRISFVTKREVAELLPWGATTTAERRPE